MSKYQFKCKWRWLPKRVYQYIHFRDMPKGYRGIILPNCLITKNEWVHICKRGQEIATKFNLEKS